jgi:hypothetical protein
MPAIIEGPPERTSLRPPLWRRLAWFVGLAALAGSSTALAAYALKALLPAA